MNAQAIAGITIYDDLMTIFQERGYSDAEATEILMKLSAQAEFEVVQEMISKLSEDQLKLLDSLPDDVSASEVAEKLNLNGEEIDALRAQKTAQLVQELIPEIDQEDQPSA